MAKDSVAEERRGAVEEAEAEGGRVAEEGRVAVKEVFVPIDGRSLALSTLSLSSTRHEKEEEELGPRDNPYIWLMSGRGRQRSQKKTIQTGHGHEKTLSPHTPAIAYYFRLKT